MPRKIHILFNLFALFVIMYIVVDTFYRVVGVQLYKINGEQVIMPDDVQAHAAKSLTTPEFAMIVERNIFGAVKKAELPPVEEVKVEPIETLEETTLELSLLGTIAGDAESARAIILDMRQKSQNIYRAGDSVQGAKIQQILRGKVVLRHGDKDEILTMVEGDEKPKASTRSNVRGRQPGQSRNARRRPVPPRPTQKASGTQAAEVDAEVEEVNISIAREDLQSSMNNLNELMTQVRVRPYFRQGKPEGLIVSQIQADSIFNTLGLMNGDIIASVNGKPMSSPEEAFQLYNSLKSGSQVSIAITRRGQKKVLNYEIQ